MICLYTEGLFAPHTTPKLEYHLLLAVLNCLINIFAATLHTGGRFSIRNLRTCHGVVTGTHLSWLYCILWWIYCNKSFRRYIVSVYNKHYWFLSSWCVSFLGQSGKVTFDASVFFPSVRCGCVCVYIYIYIYICMLKHHIILNVNTVFCQVNCLVYRSSPLYTSQVFIYSFSFLNVIKYKTFTENI